jgi:transcriptional regulator with XRE-family HTH domain
MPAREPGRALSGEGERWARFGRWVADRRAAAGLRVRDAAKRAGIGEAEWRAIEAGHREIGTLRVFVHPDAELLGRIADALGVPRAEALEHAEVPVLSPVAGDGPPESPALLDGRARALLERIRRLPPGDRELVERLVDRLLRP